MPDRLSPEQRSRIMRAVEGQDTGSELIVRRLLHAMGYRFRLQHRGLAAKSGASSLGLILKDCQSPETHGAAGWDLTARAPDHIHNSQSLPTVRGKPSLICSHRTPEVGKFNGL